MSQASQFLGLSSYYRRFIIKFAEIVSPLHALTQNNVEFMWTKDCQLVFKTLKKLMQAPMLAYPDFERSFIDASAKGLGAVFSQKQDNSQLQPVAYASRAISAPEWNYR